MSQRTVCKVKEVACSHGLTEDHHPNLQFPSSMACFNIFQLIVLVLQPRTLNFWFTPIPLTTVFSAARSSCFQQKR